MGEEHEVPGLPLETPARCLRQHSAPGPVRSGGHTLMFLKAPPAPSTAPRSSQKGPRLPPSLGRCSPWGAVPAAVPSGGSPPRPPPQGHSLPAISSTCDPITWLQVSCGPGPAQSSPPSSPAQRKGQAGDAGGDVAEWTGQCEKKKASRKHGPRFHGGKWREPTREVD